MKDSAVGTRSTLNVYTKCCGSMMCHIPEAHPWAVEVNPNGLERWSFDKLKAPDGNAPVIFGSYGSTRSLTGVPLPDAKPPIPPDVCGPCRFQLNRGFLGVPLFGGVAGDGLAKWFGDTKEGASAQAALEGGCALVHGHSHRLRRRRRAARAAVSE